MVSKIDFARASLLLDVVQKQASAAPQYMAIGSSAMNELKEMQDAASEEHAELGRQRLKAEQEEAARLTRQAQEQTDKPVKPINVKPGEPNELEEIKSHEPPLDNEVRRV